MTGDALSGAPELKLPRRPECADDGDDVKTVSRLAELDFDLCLFGHGEPLLRKASQAVRRLVYSGRS